MKNFGINGECLMNGVSLQKGKKCLMTWIGYLKLNSSGIVVCTRDNKGMEPIDVCTNFECKVAYEGGGK